MKVKIINKSEHPLPAYETQHSAGLDVRANLKEAVVLLPGMRFLVPTGLFIELPAGYEAQIRPRSGLAFKSGITVLNSPGTIDADYRGEIMILLINHSNENFLIENGLRIAQMIISKHETIEWVLSEEINQTKRGDGGYGHTGHN